MTQFGGWVPWKRSNKKNVINTELKFKIILKN